MNAETGMARAAARADRNAPNWTQDAFAALRLFLDEKPGEFMSEDVRSFAERTMGLIPAPDPRAWGSVMRRASNQGLVIQVAFRPSSNPQAHTRPTAVWRQAS